MVSLKLYDRWDMFKNMAACLLQRDSNMLTFKFWWEISNFLVFS